MNNLLFCMDLNRVAAIANHQGHRSPERWRFPFGSAEGGAEISVSPTRLWGFDTFLPGADAPWLWAVIPSGLKCLLPDSHSMIRDYEDSFSVSIGMAIALADLSVSGIVEMDF
jgi:hypothetical protein